MKAYAIVMKDHAVSERGFIHLLKSSDEVNNDFEINRFDASTVDTVEEEMKDHGLFWNYPEVGSVYDESLYLKKSAYGGPKKRRWACAMSHYRLWKKCLESHEPILILEHDATFTRQLEWPMILSYLLYDVIGINNPIGNTRLASKFVSQVQLYGRGEVTEVPTIDDLSVPQGLAGGSAYIIRPNGANNVLRACKEHGLWPNDAILCKQLIPNMGVTRKFYTDTQRIPSTTFGNN